MAKYKFRLQSVLDLRTTHRDQKQSELTEALRILQTLQGSRAEITAERRELQRQCRDINSDRQLDVQRLVELQRYEQVLRARQQEVTQQQEFWENEIQRRQSILAEADRDVKALQRVKGRHRHQHRQRQLQLEGKQLDEISMTKLQFEQR